MIRKNQIYNKSLKDELKDIRTKYDRIVKQNHSIILDSQKIIPGVKTSQSSNQINGKQYYNESNNLYSCSLDNMNSRSMNDKNEE